MSRGFPKKAASPAVIDKPESAKQAKESAPTPKGGRDSFAPLGSESSPGTILAGEKSLRGRRTEAVLFYTRDGKPFGGEITQHNPSSVVFTEKEQASLFNKGAVLTHNHPLNSSFSAADIRTLMQLGLSEIRIVGTAFNYSLRVPDIQGFQNKFGGEVESYDENGSSIPYRFKGKDFTPFSSRDEMSNYLSSFTSRLDNVYIMERLSEKLGREPSFEQYNAELTHLRVSRFAEKHGLIYERQVIEDAAE